MMNIPFIQTLKQMSDESPKGLMVETTDKIKMNKEEATYFNNITPEGRGSCQPLTRLPLYLMPLGVLHKLLKKKASLWVT